jgi:hypothetical protein
VGTFLEAATVARRQLVPPDPRANENPGRARPACFEAAFGLRRAGQTNPRIQRVNHESQNGEVR